MGTRIASNKMLQRAWINEDRSRSILLGIGLPIAAGRSAGPGFEGMIEVRHILIAEFGCNFFYRQTR